MFKKIGIKIKIKIKILFYRRLISEWEHTMFIQGCTFSEYQKWTRFYQMKIYQLKTIK
jgi:hypothetical protein